MVTDDLELEDRAVDTIGLYLRQEIFVVAAAVSAHSPVRVNEFLQKTLQPNRA
jgi:hypothetical protein